MGCLFAYWCLFGRQMRAWPHGADPPHFDIHIGKIGQFFKIRGFSATHVGFGVNGPYKTTGHLQNTHDTTVRLPLAAAGSKPAL